MDSKPHNTLSLIRKLTEDKEIEIDQSFDLTIGKLISLSLIYEDKERASWRQLWLSRLFSDKIENVRAYIDYLKNITIIANWMAKEFWKIRKQFNIAQVKDEIFVYFIIKFQYSSLKMALNIMKGNEKYMYLFEPNRYKEYQPK